MRWSALPAAALLALPACIARLPEEPPRRILRLDRPIPVHLVSAPAGLPVFALADDGGPGRRLGTTPLLVEHLTVAKEIWKHGGESPSPPAVSAPAAPRLAHRWSFVIERQPERLERLDFTLSEVDLERAFALGRVQLQVPPSGASVAGTTRPAPVAP